MSKTLGEYSGMITGLTQMYTALKTLAGKPGEVGDSDTSSISKETGLPTEDVAQLAGEVNELVTPLTEGSSELIDSSLDSIEGEGLESAKNIIKDQLELSGKPAEFINNFLDSIVTEEDLVAENFVNAFQNTVKEYSEAEYTKPLSTEFVVNKKSSLGNSIQDTVTSLVEEVLPTQNTVLLNESKQAITKLLNTYGYNDSNRINELLRLINSVQSLKTANLQAILLGFPNIPEETVSIILGRVVNIKNSISGETKELIRTFLESKGFPVNTIESVLSNVDDLGKLNKEDLPSLLNNSIDSTIDETSLSNELSQKMVEGVSSSGGDTLDFDSFKNAINGASILADAVFSFNEDFEVAPFIAQKEMYEQCRSHERLVDYYKHSRADFYQDAVPELSKTSDNLSERKARFERMVNYIG